MAGVYYKRMRDLLDATLGEYAEVGFSLQEPDDDTVVLYFKDKKIATYSSKGTTIGEIRKDCSIHLLAMTGEG